MNTLIAPEDLAPFATIDPAKLEAMIEDATAIAVRVAPCLADTDDDGIVAAARAIIRGAILRWNDAGSGAVTQQTAGPFTHTIDTTKLRRGMFWPSEITDLQALCSAATRSAFTIDTAPRSRFGVHADVCSVRWGASCSCGSSINRYEGPLYEGGLLS